MGKKASAYHRKLAGVRLQALDDALGVASEVYRREFWKRHMAGGMTPSSSAAAQAELANVWAIVDGLTKLVSTQDKVFKKLCGMEIFPEPAETA